MVDVQPPNHIRVRFAPSPTGFLHIGGLRTALFNWLFAKHNGGQFILRIEDTDEKRYVPGSADSLMASLKWLGIEWDEGPDNGGPYSPYVQSQRHEMGIYKKYIDQLLASGNAYKSFTTEEQLQQMRADAESRGIKAFRFRGPERDWAPDQVCELEAQGLPYTVRLKVPLEGTTDFTDVIRGGERIVVNNAELYDIVLVKSSGMPVYHLAHVVDDHLMGISHVIRSDEWVPSTPYHVMLYQAFGWNMPIFAHVPTIQRQDGRGKLSKRKDDVAANRFWERGYLPEAMLNYLALQGWAPGDKAEILSREEIIERFTLDRVQASPARWNPEKLRDLNGIYIRRLTTTDLTDRIVPFLAEKGLIEETLDRDQRAYVEKLVSLIQERIEELADAPHQLDFFFRDVVPTRGGSDGTACDAFGGGRQTGNECLYYDSNLLVQKRMDILSTIKALEAANDRLVALEEWSHERIEEGLRSLAVELGLKTGQLFGSIRVAITGRTAAPPLFETMLPLGRERVVARITAAKEALCVLDMQSGA